MFKILFKISNSELNVAGEFPVSFKRRKNSGYRQDTIKFGTTALKFNKTSMLEGIYMIFLKKKVKSFTKKNKNVKVWFFLEKNYPISRKEKNSRMGKGKGFFERMVFRVRKGKIMLEFKNANLVFLQKTINFFKKKTGITIGMINIDQRAIFLGKFNYSTYNLFLQY